MNKINGYTEEEAKRLVKYITDGKKAGAPLSGLFAEYAKKTGRAKGSVRNYYYALLRSTGDERVRNMLSGTDLKAEKIIPFSELETDKILKDILVQKSKGVKPFRRRRQAYAEIPEQIPQRACKAARAFRAYCRRMRNYGRLRRRNAQAYRK